MGSGDLNMKKSWHPLRSGNVAATQKAEAEAIAERKKLQLRLQEIEEERRKEEIQNALEASGGKRKIDRVEWMYAGSTDGQAGDGAEKEAYLLGKRRIDKLLQDNETKKLQKQPSQDSIVATPAIGNPRDIAAKIREDPLLAIKRQEQQAYEAMMNDPIKRRQLLSSLGIDDPQQKEKPREEKRHKHRHHHRSHRDRDEDRDEERYSRRRRSDSRDRSRSPRRHDADEDRRRRRRDSPERRRPRSESRNGRGGRDRRGRLGGSRARRSQDSRSRENSRSPAPASRRTRSTERGEPLKRLESRGDDRNGDRNGDRGGRQNRGTFRSLKADERDSRPRTNGRASSNHTADGDRAEEERARKLAAMQEAATDLDKDRQRRLAAIEESERAAQEADDRARQRNKTFGGDAGFTTSLHSRAADMKVASRLTGAR
ncbi:Pre-mRNA splicing factor-domain-containing protein [Lasiosphaeria miniovina]|uniref:Pre-mRNA splicing factor-domain-containing protein n=1 Tax=Lasiosphaeria miniovina TaxID=1954250 RepID=A0AA40BGD3_9PEZI|nr:Pre-mRNA splicing factor-domain-containing protein [Lasiosphaeria miniovina]KAK0733752.1 Pre-mRNA splicing factor-domain-containing protein [Lasiosphaeria miniovina]